MSYRLADPLPPIGTRVEHDKHGPGVIVGDHAESGQWFVEFDQPFDTLTSGAAVKRGWVYPYNLAPVQEPT